MKFFTKEEVAKIPLIKRKDILQPYLDDLMVSDLLRDSLSKEEFDRRVFFLQKELQEVK